MSVYFVTGATGVVGSAIEANTVGWNAGGVNEPVPPGKLAAAIWLNQGTTTSLAAAPSSAPGPAPTTAAVSTNIQTLPVT